MKSKAGSPVSIRLFFEHDALAHVAESSRFYAVRSSARGNERLTIGGKREVQDGALVRELGFEDGIGRLRRVVADLPGANAAINAAGHEFLAVGSEGDRI